MQDPHQGHWEAALRILHYLKSSPKQAILLAPHKLLDLHVYCDSDWASCPVTRRPITGYLVKLGNAPVSWKTKKQVTTSRFSVEAKYRLMANASSEIV